ncbi:MAG: hypothetical protein IPI33_02570 [Dehalococcoidia bacterium]|uniref:hypothetical protein n=1 Tax=Candidatus Amarobacter glycogenicus TaxID=3140699 RepID=UPI001D70F80A|nr:hypothetical protein [Dehalococcoidia bacterium]MBK6560232.1 hypothetical protein [Dehalococcoidia bacterium]MBK7125833.1 hypothetical protein [Dehalococcoidia bacterium]MBK7724159.1 hypothetical protein [Dehalococcoidia bacterium]MBK9546756.1 hypothetical protein [Dehalococcoidia bacterium]
METLPEESPAEMPVVCTHHWKLGSPVGGVSTGLCRDCGASREFGQILAPSAYGRLRRK